MKSKRKKPILTVAYNDETIAIEELPCPVVLYPGHYGAFFVFKESLDSNEYFLCECSKKALLAFLELHATYDSPYNANVSYKSNFAISFINYIYSNYNICTYMDFFEAVSFKNNLCHKCNQKVPSYSFCHPMYGNRFKQNYGWYVEQRIYEYGIYFSPYGLKITDKYTPDDIKSDLAKYFKINLINATKEELDITNKAIKKIMEYIENSVRIELSTHKIGERWTNETSLYKFVCSIMTDKKVIFHYRPDCLNGLEIDVFIPYFNIGIEYQGIQHFKPIEHFGGKEAFTKRRIHDMEKDKLCRENGIILIYFTYMEDINENLVKERLKQYIELGD